MWLKTMRTLVLKQFPINSIQTEPNRAANDFRPIRYTIKLFDYYMLIDV